MRLTAWFLLGGLCVFLLFHTSYCRIIIETNQLPRSLGQQYRGWLPSPPRMQSSGREGANIVGKRRPALPPPVGAKNPRP
ncbi:hypothetical protein I3760_16G098700 [Carya illinoinensis]|nr:hypothetical protein I3760_16G098700 [Carya illinoinensis]